MVRNQDTPTGRQLETCILLRSCRQGFGKLEKYSIFMSYPEYNQKQDNTQIQDTNAHVNALSIAVHLRDTSPVSLTCLCVNLH